MLQKQSSSLTIYSCIYKFKCEMGSCTDHGTSPMNQTTLNFLLSLFRFICLFHLIHMREIKIRKSIRQTNFFRANLFTLRMNGTFTAHMNRTFLSEQMNRTTKKTLFIQWNELCLIVYVCVISPFISMCLYCSRAISVYSIFFLLIL